MQSDKMCPVTLGNHKTKTPIGRHPWQPPTPAGFEQGVPWRSPCEHSNSSRIRAHATQNAVRQNAFRYLRSRLQHQQAPKLWIQNAFRYLRSRLQHQQASKLWISSRILCNNFLGALPLTPKEGSADILSIFIIHKYSYFIIYPYPRSHTKQIPGVATESLDHGAHPWHQPREDWRTHGR